METVDATHCVYSFVILWIKSMMEGYSDPSWSWKLAFSSDELLVT